MTEQGTCLCTFLDVNCVKPSPFSFVLRILYFSIFYILLKIVLYIDFWFNTFNSPHIRREQMSLVWRKDLPRKDIYLKQYQQPQLISLSRMVFKWWHDYGSNLNSVILVQIWKEWGMPGLCFDLQIQVPWSQWSWRNRTKFPPLSLVDTALDLRQ